MLIQKYYLGKMNLDAHILQKWRQLGFYYDFDKRTEVNQWRFYGSKQGLRQFSSLVQKYMDINKEKGEHEHYGPYGYLKIMTTEKPMITEDYIGGTLDDLKKLSLLISQLTDSNDIGTTFNIGKEYSEENTATIRFFIMADNFDPSCLDELVVSQRQEVVNMLSSKRTGL